MAAGCADERDWPSSALRTVMVLELARRGFAEGRNLVVLPRWGSGNDIEALAKAAQALADAKSDVIVAVSLPAVWAARAAPDTRSSRPLLTIRSGTDGCIRKITGSPNAAFVEQSVLRTGSDAYSASRIADTCVLPNAW